MEKIENILFIGFMGCGKSTLARAFAQENNRVFLDSDALIELKWGKSVGEIFRAFGESFFRQEEQKMANFFSTFIGASIAAGGGFIGVSNLEKIGFCVYLRADFSYLKNRLSKEELTKRPLFCNENEAKKLYNERLKIYENKANLVLDIENKSIQELLNEMKVKL